MMCSPMAPDNPQYRMKAAVITRYGPPEVVRIEEVDKPTPGDDELLIRIGATTVNRTDCGYRGGKPFIIRFLGGGFPRPTASIGGTEFAGEVEAIGSAVTGFNVGDRVCAVIAREPLEPTPST